MKRTIILFCIALTTVEAVSIGNPAEPALLEEGFWISDRRISSMRLGALDDLLFSKRMKPAPESSQMGISHTELNWKLLTADVGWNIRERFDLHLLVGSLFKLNFRWKQQERDFEMTARDGIFWAGSGSISILEVKNTTLGFSAQGGGIQWIHGTLSQNSTNQSTSSRLLFWQIATGLSQNIEPLHPYIGCVVNHLFLHIFDPSLRFQQLLGVGIYEGCTLSFGSRIFLNIEARQLFESGLSLAGELRF